MLAQYRNQRNGIDPVRPAYIGYFLGFAGSRVTGAALPYLPIRTGGNKPNIVVYSFLQLTDVYIREEGRVSTGCEGGVEYGNYPPPPTNTPHHVANCVLYIHTGFIPSPPATLVWYIVCRVSTQLNGNISLAELPCRLSPFWHEDFDDVTVNGTALGALREPRP
ncbi:hypothetical protein J6590_062653 [Homalodisca vitripennis]|nr:hypothetical protein J6590_062653 [Homalodisca vitripennis]